MMVETLDLIVFSAIASTVGVGSIAVTRSRKKDTSVEVIPRPTIRRDARLQHDARRASIAVRFDQWLEHTLIRGGVGLDSNIVMMIILCLAATAGGVILVIPIHINAWHVAVASAVFLGMIPVGLIAIYLKMVVRIAKFRKQFPAALELLARATKAGENVEQAFQTAGKSAEEPLRAEFLHCTQQMKWGMDPQRVVEDLAQRIDTVDLHLMTHVVAIHQKLGGRLGESLERLSTVIRDRSQCEEKIKSMTSVGRYSVAAIIVMGIFVLCYMLSAQPEYVENLFATALGNKLLIYAGISELVGLIWVGMALKSDL